MAPRNGIVVLGAAGRMGRMVLGACAARVGRADFPMHVSAALEAPGSPAVGSPAGVEGVDISVTDRPEEALGRDRVVIDFTHPMATMSLLPLIVKSGAGLVLGTTGFSDREKDGIRDAARSVPIVMAPNMSLGVNLLFRAAETIARTLGPEYDVEIVEAHHNQKKDAPSGTALGFAEAVARGHAVNLRDHAVYGRQGQTGVRRRGEIGIHAVRGGDIAGDHTVLFAAGGERVELRHVAHSRQPFAEGAVKAALFLRERDTGLYSMHDVLGL